ncbi:hypothetical protein [uncultured Pseudodesulfovibrio sp.]|uniref:hypothetical protein n=1 Tax=uncultured Pseudodesulfovibrio sp. TaxID=2035858 RepID=UPI0029C7C6E0|nr:hypothetical protein [uncultured Pseudodesulfovibrio sp.]
MCTMMKSLILAILSLLLLTGCIASKTDSGLSIDPICKNYAAMTENDAAISTAVAVQSATPPLLEVDNVVFAQGAIGLSEPDLGLQGFEFTGAKLYASRAPGSAPGLSIGEVELTDPLGRRAGFLYRVEYTTNGDEIRLTGLRMEPVQCAAPRVDVAVVRAADLPKGRMTYTDMVRFLAANALTLSELTAAGSGQYAIIALGRDRVGPEATMTIAVSATATGAEGHDAGCGSSVLEGGWPVAVLVGTLSPASNDKLYAKVSFKSKPGFAMTKKIGVYQIAAFGN